MNVSDWTTYNAFDVVVKSNVALPELEITPAQQADITLELKPATKLSGDPCWFDHWFSDGENSEIVLSIARENGAYRLRFPEFADFMVTFDGRDVTCLPEHATSPETIRHLFLDHVLPRMLGQQGNLILHASSVEIARDVGIAIVGESGWGKSTLASSFRHDGSRFLGDDCLKFKVEDGNLIGISAYEGSRLWEDSIEALYPSGAKSSSVSHYSSKRRVIVVQENFVRETSFKALFFLRKPEEHGDVKIHIEKLQGVKMIMALIRRSFLLDIEHIQSATGQFQVIRQLITTHPRVYSLQYPRQYALLPEVRQAIRNTVLDAAVITEMP